MYESRKVKKCSVQRTSGRRLVFLCHFLEIIITIYILFFKGERVEKPYTILFATQAGTLNLKTYNARKGYLYFFRPQKIPFFNSF